MSDTSRTPVPMPWVKREEYRVVRPAGAIDLVLDGTRTPPPDRETTRALLRALASDERLLVEYPSPTALTELLAAKHGLTPDRIFVGAGADEVLDRLMRVMLGPGRELLVATPTFEMIPRYASMTGATVVGVPWPDHAFPVDELIERTSAATGVIALVSPNNPTGVTIPRNVILRIAEAAREALVVVDHAYIEYAAEDHSEEYAALPNVAVVRTLSKAWGAPGIRIGYALASRDMTACLRSTGGPYSMSTPSLAAAVAALTRGRDYVRAHVQRVADERDALSTALAAFPGAFVWPSEASFVTARVPTAGALVSALAKRGIAIRLFPSRPELANVVRVTCPANERSFERLVAAIREINVELRS